MIETTFLIIGGGPAGASLACFLSAHHFKGLLIDADSGTTRTPKAHITNPAALECLRDIGLEEAAKHDGMPKTHMLHYRWGHDMAGEEYARVHSWGNHPEQKGQYEEVTPCAPIDLPQTLLEPILIQRAIASGWTVRYDSTFQRFERKSPTSRIISTIQDNLTGQTYQISSKYLFGCDGARSTIMRQLEIPLLRQPGQGLAFNILVDVDLSKHIEPRMGNLHVCLTPEIEHPPWGFAAIARVIKPWNQWIFIVLPQPGYDDFTTIPSHEAIEQRMRQWIGDDSLPFSILNVSKWLINEIVAERYSDGNVFCLGDAVHRHPPVNGLGSNTCIQDAWNLAWKAAYVEYQQAGPRLLDSFSLERQPIGAGVVQRANQGLRNQGPVMEALGMTGATVEERVRQYAELSAATEAGRIRRKRLQEGVRHVIHEVCAIGIEMNQRYRSKAIYLSDEFAPQGSLPADPILTHEVTTYPGSRVPHAWLNKSVPGQQISTIDLAGHECFVLLTGIGGEEWIRAARKYVLKTGIILKAYSIGWRQDYEDVYGDWARKREIEEDGCVLLRPDRVVCWRSMMVRRDCFDALYRVMQSILDGGPAAWEEVVGMDTA